MSSIDIRRRHNKSLKDARAAIERVTDKVADRFEVDYGWDGNTMNFSRAGVDGHIALGEKEIHVTAKLGFLLSMLKGPIESEIHRFLDEEFG